MQPAPSTSLAPPSIPAMRQLSEKPRQGFETKKTARKPGPSSCNFKVTLGLRATVVENGVRKTYSARYYNPNTGRFMSRNPEDGNANDPQSLHKYLYAGGDPVNRIDPSGRMDGTTAGRMPGAGMEYATIILNVSLDTTASLAAVACAVIWLGYSTRAVLPVR